MIIIRDNKETFAASKCSLTLLHYHYQQRLLVFHVLAFSSFESREPKQLLMLLCSLFLFIFLLPDFTLDVLTEYCTHRLFVFASTAANFIETIATYTSLLQYEFWVYCKIRSRIKAFLQIQRNIGKIMLGKIVIVIDILF